MAQGRGRPGSLPSHCLHLQTPAEENENLKELGRRLVRQEGLPKFEPVQLTLDMLMQEGEWRPCAARRQCSAGLCLRGGRAGWLLC